VNRTSACGAVPSRRDTGVSPESCRGAIVVVERAAQALAPLDRACVSQMARLWADESVRQPLVIALAMVMRDEVLNGGPQRVLSK
jgi:hypothetical protein